MTRPLTQPHAVASTRVSLPPGTCRGLLGETLLTGCPDWQEGVSPQTGQNPFQLSPSEVSAGNQVSWMLHWKGFGGHNVSPSSVVGNQTSREEVGCVHRPPTPKTPSCAEGLPEAHKPGHPHDKVLFYSNVPQPHSLSTPLSNYSLHIEADEPRDTSPAHHARVRPPTHRHPKGEGDTREVNAIVLKSTVPKIPSLGFFPY